MSVLASSRSRAFDLRGYDIQLLDLPSELRHHIYQQVMSLPRMDHLALLCACQLIYNECIATFLSRVFAFENQRALLTALASRPRGHLGSIRTLKFALTDLGEKDMRPYLTSVVSNHNGRTLISPYSKEVHDMSRLLSKLQSVRAVAIKRPLNNAARLPPEVLVEAIVNLTTTQLPHLESLTLNVDNFSVRNLQEARNLKSLQFSGFSNSTPRETQQALTGMSHLQELHIRPAGYTMREPFFHCGKPIQSISPTVITAIQPLRALTVMDPPERLADNAAFVSHATLHAIRAAHADSLERLAVHSIHPMSLAVVTAIKTLLQSTKQLRCLSLAIPASPCDTCRMLEAVSSPSLHTIELLIASTADVADVLQVLETCKRGRFPRLREIVLLTFDREARSEDLSLAPAVVPAKLEPESDSSTVHIKNLCEGHKTSFDIQWRRWRPFDDFDLNQNG